MLFRCAPSLTNPRT